MSDFKPRTTKPTSGMKLYNNKANNGLSSCIKGSPTDTGCNVLANCVGYACGRFSEICNKAAGLTSPKMTYPNFCCNPSGFLEVAKAYGLETGKKPALGAILVWSGHVAIVEAIKDNTHITISESRYGSVAFQTRDINNDDGKWNESKYTFTCFIYNPYYKPEEEKDDGVRKEEVKETKKEIITCPCCGEKIYNDGTEIEEVVVSTTPELNEVVKFKGGMYFNSEYGGTFKAALEGLATVTKISEHKDKKGCYYPYHLVRVKGEGSTVWGWVKEDDIEKVIL